jgi:hypothetical protein
MWRIIIILALILFLSGLAGGVFYVCQKQRDVQPLAITTTSPNKTYTVQLNEQVSASTAPFGVPNDHGVKFKLSKSGQLIIQNEWLYRGDSLDSRFGDLFPQYNWVSNSIIRFGGGDINTPSQSDEVKVTNETDELITYLAIIIEKQEMFLIFDLQPHYTITLSVHPQTDQRMDSSWINCWGKFKDDKAVPQKGVNFRIRGKYKGPAHYSIIIRETGVAITSQEF